MSLRSRVKKHDAEALREAKKYKGFLGKKKKASLTGAVSGAAASEKGHRLRGAGYGLLGGGLGALPGNMLLGIGAGAKSRGLMAAGGLAALGGAIYGGIKGGRLAAREGKILAAARKAGKEKKSMDVVKLAAAYISENPVRSLQESETLAYKVAAAMSVGRGMAKESSKRHAVVEAVKGVPKLFRDARRIGRTTEKKLNVHPKARGLRGYLHPIRSAREGLRIAKDPKAGKVYDSAGQGMLAITRRYASGVRKALER